MTYLAPHYDADIFVSYSHGDPRGGGSSPLKDWTHALIKNLEGQIFSLDTEFDSLNVWMDKQIDPTAQLTAELQGKVGASGILFIIMSKRYLASSWCRDELEWFKKQVTERAGEPGRVFVIRAQPTETSAWPEFLRDERGHPLLGFTFYDQADGMPHGWPDLHDVNRDFVKEMCRLQTALTKRLRELRDSAEARAKAAAQAKAPPPKPGGPRRIYLYAAPESEGTRAEMGRLLTGDGMVPLTAQAGGGGLADWQRDSAARIETAKRCDALALVRGDDGDRFVGELLDIGVDERERITNARGAPLPCAVLDKTGLGLPIDVAPFGIERFDVNATDWKGAFRNWLDISRAQAAAVP